MAIVACLRVLGIVCGKVSLRDQGPRFQVFFGFESAVVDASRPEAEVPVLRRHTLWVLAFKSPGWGT